MRIDESVKVWMPMAIALVAMLAVVFIGAALDGTHSDTNSGLFSNGSVPSAPGPFDMNNGTSYLSLQSVSIEVSIAVALDIGMVILGMFIALKDD